MVTPPELKIVCGESNEINGEKTVMCSTSEKNCLLFLRSEKIVFKLGVKKSLITKKNYTPPPPNVSNGQPLSYPVWRPLVQVLVVTVITYKAMTLVSCFTGSNVRVTHII